MRIPLVRSGDDHTPPAWWEWLFAPVIWPVFWVALVGLAVLSILALPFLMISLQMRERRFSKLMRERDRFIPWTELEPRLKAGEGTLLVEQAQKDAVRVWWTSEDVMRAAPTQAPEERELDYLRFMEPHAFVSWCFGRFLSPEAGEAILTDPQYSYPPGFIKEAFFKQRFPNLRVVMTVKFV
jgi:hypothetical protein